MCPYGINRIGLAVPDLDKRATSSSRINAPTLKVYLLYSAMILNTFRFEKFDYGPLVHARGLITSKRTKPSGLVGPWCWVVSSAGASYYFGIW